MFIDGVDNILDDPVGALRDSAPATPADADTVTETEAPPTDPVDTAEPTDERPRDEKGRFISTEKQEKLLAYLAKYGDDPDKAYEASVEAQSTIGRLGQELGELRSVLTELPDRINQQPQAPANLEDLISEQPQQVAVWALQQGNQEPVYEAAMREWFDQNPLEAARFEQNLRMEMLRAEIQAQQQPIQQSLKQQQEQQAVAEFARQHPDVGAYAEQIQQQAAQNPVLSRLLSSEDPQEKVGALAVLYQLAKQSGAAAPPPTVDTASPQPDPAQAAAQAIAAAEQAKAQAAVVTAGNSNTGEPPAPNIADQIWEAWGKHDISRLRDS